jgi:hypothetical protein
MPPAAATAAGRARKSRPNEGPRSGTGQPAGRRKAAPAGQYVDEFRVTDRRSQRGSAPSGRAATAYAAAAPAPARPSRARRDRAPAGAPAGSGTTRKRREVHVTPSSQTSAFERVLGTEPRRGRRSDAGRAPQPLMMAPRRRIPRMDTGILNVSTQISSGIALPRPHIGRPAIKRPQVRRPALARPHLARPHFSRAAASQQLDRIIRSRLWIAILGVMLVSIVGMRVEVLKLGTKTGTAVQTASALQAQYALDQAKVARLENPSRLSRLALQHGMTQPGVTDTRFLTPGSAKDVAKAIQGITPPNASRFESNLAAAETANGDSEATTADISPTDSASSAGSDTTDAGGTVPVDASTPSDQ